MSGGNVSDFNGMAPAVFTKVTMTYVSTTERIATIVFSDENNDTIATLTYTYDGNDRIDTITKS